MLYSSLTSRAFVAYLFIFILNIFHLSWISVTYVVNLIHLIVFAFHDFPHVCES